MKSSTCTTSPDVGSGRVGQGADRPDHTEAPPQARTVKEQRVFRVADERRLNRPPRKVADLVDPHQRPAGQHCLHGPLRKGHLHDAIGIGKW